MLKNHLLDKGYFTQKYGRIGESEGCLSPNYPSFNQGSFSDAALIVKTMERESNNSIILLTQGFRGIKKGE